MFLREVQQVADCLCSSLSGTIEPLLISYSVHACRYGYVLCALSSTNSIEGHTSTLLTASHDIGYLGRFPVISREQTPVHAAASAPGFRAR